MIEPPNRFQMKMCSLYLDKEMPYGAFFYAQYLILTRKEQKKPPKVGKPRGVAGVNWHREEKPVWKQAQNGRGLNDLC